MATPTPPAIHAIATMDTKGDEITFIAHTIRAAGATVITVDVGTQSPPSITPDIHRETIAAHHPSGPAAVLNKTDRGQAVTAMSQALTAFMLNQHAQNKISGVIGIGGSGGTALIAPAMRALPVGLPKLLVSTVASGNVAQYVGASDIAMMYSVTDVAGLNRVSKIVLANAARAIAAMATPATDSQDQSDRPAIGLTMFGVTTPCVTAVRKSLEPRYDCLTFHATGTGGQAMEKLVESGLIDAGVIDVTTTEVADLVAGGVFACLPTRFDVILQKRIPYVLSVGALDMVNFGPRETVPAKYAHRKFHVHNPQVTLMRTTPEENRAAATFIAEKLNRAAAPFTLLIPENGVSALDAKGQPFWDEEADAALFDTLESTIHSGPNRKIHRLPHHINDPAFAEALVSAFSDVARAPRP
jgi:uncharacterized protein (UPF0261 family)